MRRGWLQAPSSLRPPAPVPQRPAAGPPGGAPRSCPSVRSESTARSAGFLFSQGVSPRSALTEVTWPKKIKSNSFSHVPLSRLKQKSRPFEEDDVISTTSEPLLLPATGLRAGRRGVQVSPRSGGGVSTAQRGSPLSTRRLAWHVPSAASGASGQRRLFQKLI